MSSVWIKNSDFKKFPSLDKNIKTDVLIIGGGITGILCGYMLKKAGVQCVIAESDRILSGVTGNTTAKITVLHGFIYDKTLEELKALSLNGTAEKIPTLKEVLTVCENKTPLLIEFKDQPDKTYVSRAVNILKNYKGEFAVQTFNPFILNQIK